MGFPYETAKNRLLAGAQLMVRHFQTLGADVATENLLRFRVFGIRIGAPKRS